jgi:hypothetical protein
MTNVVVICGDQCCSSCLGSLIVSCTNGVLLPQWPMCLTNVSPCQVEKSTRTTPSSRVATSPVANRCAPLRPMCLIVVLIRALTRVPQCMSCNWSQSPFIVIDPMWLMSSMYFQCDLRCKDHPCNSSLTSRFLFNIMKPACRLRVTPSLTLSSPPALDCRRPSRTRPFCPRSSNNGQQSSTRSLSPTPWHKRRLGTGGMLSTTQPSS